MTCLDVWLLAEEPEKKMISEMLHYITIKRNIAEVNIAPIIKSLYFFLTSVNKGQELSPWPPILHSNDNKFICSTSHYDCSCVI